MARIPLSWGWFCDLRFVAHGALLVSYSTYAITLSVTRIVKQVNVYDDSTLSSTPITVGFHDTRVSKGPELVPFLLLRFGVER